MAEENVRAIEAIVMVADGPVPPELLGQLIEEPVGRVEELCSELALSYEAEDRGFQLQRAAGGYRFVTHADMAPYVERFVVEGQSSRLSAAALETLAIVAYKQPVSRAQVSAIRGVDADGVLRTLVQRGFVHEIGRDPGPGQAVLYGTTTMFLERLGLDSVDDLPALGEFVPEADVVEALEQGLRVAPEPVPEAATEPGPSADDHDSPSERAAPAVGDDGDGGGDHGVGRS
jgi:segregation and condensation protein B